MLSVNPYLNFPGNTEDAMKFYKSVFGGDFAMFQRFKDLPGADKQRKDELDKVMHASLPLGKNNVIMATDSLESMGQKVVMGNNFYICISTESEDETNQLFNKLSAGGKIEMPLNKTFWGAYFGMCTDKFGVQWMLSYDAKPNA